VLLCGLSMTYLCKPLHRERDQQAVDHLRPIKLQLSLTCFISAQHFEVVHQRLRNALIIPVNGECLQCPANRIPPQSVVHQRQIGSNLFEFLGVSLHRCLVESLRDKW
jgi:hypothetical protein